MRRTIKSSLPEFLEKQIASESSESSEVNGRVVADRTPEMLHVYEDEEKRKRRKGMRSGLFKFQSKQLKSQG